MAEAEVVATEVESKPAARRKKVKQKISHGVAHIKATFNNTLVTITKPDGGALAFYSAGKDFKGSRKSTPFAAQRAAEEVAAKVVENFGMIV